MNILGGSRTNPLANSIQQSLMGTLSGQNVPWSDDVRARAFSQRADQAGAQEQTQRDILRGSMANRGIAGGGADLRGQLQFSGQRADANARARNQIDVESALQNFAAQERARTQGTAEASRRDVSRNAQANYLMNNVMDITQTGSGGGGGSSGGGGVLGGGGGSASRGAPMGAQLGSPRRGVTGGYNPQGSRYTQGVQQKRPYSGSMAKGDPGRPNIQRSPRPTPPAASGMLNSALAQLGLPVGGIPMEQASLQGPSQSDTYVGGNQPGSSMVGGGMFGLGANMPQDQVRNPMWGSGPQSYPDWLQTEYGSQIQNPTGGVGSGIAPYNAPAPFNPMDYPQWAGQQYGAQIFNPSGGVGRMIEDPNRRRAQGY